MNFTKTSEYKFLEQLREYVTTMVCVAVKGKPLIGVIHQPFSKQSITSWSWLGNGISNNLQQKNKVTYFFYYDITSVFLL